VATHPLFKFIRHKWLNSGKCWQPFVGIYYLTYACDFRCPYCANGVGIPYHRLPNSAVRGSRALRVLGRIRRHVDHLVLTGGEPLLHPDAPAVIGRLARLRFDSVTLTTNGERIDVCLPEIAANVTTLVVSLDSLDARKADVWYGKGRGMLERILDNIERAAQFPGRRYEILISAVATPNNIEDLQEVYAFARRRGFWFAATPELHGVKLPEKLRHDPDYRKFFAFLRREKERGGRIFGSRQYLDHMGQFRYFRCRPLTTLTVDPGGGVFYPCLERSHCAGNLLEDDLDTLRHRAEHDSGLTTDCTNACHSACALGLSLLINRPLGETADFLRGILRWRHHVLSGKTVTGE
jgi:MoaA/NifB/PqqE/SkfB family radical SAM enzyme